MHVDADHLDPAEPGGAAVELARLAIRDPELRRLESRRDVGVRLGVDVRVHAEGHPRLRPLRPRHLVDGLELGGRLDVEGEDVGLQPLADLLARLAHPREHDPPRLESGPERAVELAPRDHVGARAEPGEQPEDGQVHVGLDGVADEMRQARERLVVGLVDLGDGARGVDVGGRAHRFGDPVEGRGVAVEATVLVAEGVHRLRAPFPEDGSTRVGPNQGRAPRRWRAGGAWPRHGIRTAASSEGVDSLARRARSTAVTT